MTLTAPRLSNVPPGAGVRQTRNNSLLVYILLAVGLVLLCAGGEFLVRGAVGAARRLGVSPLLIGITLVGFGTSMPELVASVKAALADAPGIAIGNVVGSNIANVLLIIGTTALIAPIYVMRGPFPRDATVMMAAALLVGAVVLTDFMARWAGLLFLAALSVYLIYCYVSERRNTKEGAQHVAEAEEIEAVEGPLWKALLVTAIGLAGVIAGARLLVDSAIELATLLGISETVIGVSVVAVGTSLPELAASITAALRRHADVAFGNIVGSNIFNLLFILGVTATIKPIPVPDEIIRLDYWVMLGAMALLVVVSATGWKIVRREAMLFLLLYAGYMTLVFSPAAQSLIGLQ